MSSIMQNELPNHTNICFKNRHNNITIKRDMLNDLTNGMFKFVKHTQHLNQRSMSDNIQATMAIAHR